MKLYPTSDEQGLRSDVWLTQRLPELSRARVQSLIKAGHITVEGRRVRPHAKITEHMAFEVDIPPPEQVEISAEDIPVDVVHEDSDIIVVNKQSYWMGNFTWNI